MMQKINLTIFLSLFILSSALVSRADGALSATIVDLKNSKIVLTKLITSKITVKTGESQQVVPLDQVREIIMTSKPGTFKIKMTSGTTVAGSSNSLIQGTWELGEYKISLGKVKSLVMNGAAPASNWKKPAGFAASVTDVQGSVTDIYGFGLKYTYHYTRSNCMWNCGSSSKAALHVLPVNQGKGALMIALKAIASITDIQSTSKYPVTHSATITLKDGTVIKANFGNFADEKIRSIQGKTELGEFSLALNKTRSIVFRHDRNISPLPKYEWGDKKKGGTASITCQSGLSYILSHTRKYSPSSNGKVGRYQRGKSTIQIKIGEAENNVNMSKIAKINVTPKKESKYKTQYPIVLTTKTGNQVNAILEDRKYLGGFTRNGWFYYVKVKELKEISFK